MRVWSSGKMLPSQGKDTSPTLVTRSKIMLQLQDIKGDLHNHTNFIEGENTLAEMIAKAQSLGYSYYSYCDHAPSIKARGFEEIKKIVEERRGFVDDYNFKSPNFKLFLGFEVNILARGGLAWSDDLLSQLDFVVASVHNNLRDPKEKMTARLISALQNSYVSILGHPTCRLISSRQPSDADWEKVFAVAAKNGKIMEINANPKRLDLPEELVKIAKGHGLKFLISSDAHSVPEQDLMKYGVAVAQRAGLTADDVVNTWDYEKLKKYLGR